MSHTVSQILVAARRNPELVASETAAYMVLSLAEQSLSGPRRVCAEHVLLHPGGAITVGDVDPCSNQENDARLRALLRDLLACSVPATVSEALTRVSVGQAEGPVAVRAELQTALVPLNRGAARRALARLYRKLTEAGAELGVAVVSEESSERAMARRSKRRGAVVKSDEIVVAVDETAFRVASRTGELRTSADAAPAKSEHVCPADPLGVNWYPAQTTPWQFRDRSISAGDGTPILGSVMVRRRGSLEASRPEAAVALQADAAPLEGTYHQPPPDLQGARPAADDFPAKSEEWVDTFVDAPVAVDSTEAAPAFNPRRSSVSELVERMSVAPYRMELARKSLLEMVDEPLDEPEFVGLGTVTPPPVAQDAVSELVPPSRRGPRRIVLSALAAGAAGLSAWAMFTQRGSEDAGTIAAMPRACEASVHVEVHTSARVFLNDAVERSAQVGPLARFDGVPCGAQAEVTVQVPSPGGSPLPDAWVRMPLPEVELRAAFERGTPLVIAPLGDHK